MRKNEEISCPTSCFNKARGDERMFVVLERDEAFVETVRFWAAKRVELGINRPEDAKILDAMLLAECVERGI